MQSNETNINNIANNQVHTNSGHIPTYSMRQKTPFQTKNYKDTVFRMLFNNKERLLELYNAINGTNYNDPELLTITTLEGKTYLNMKNDVSFLVVFELNLYEHQSTPCPNIPLRFMYYLSTTLKKIIPIVKTYRESTIKIPEPRFFVFYNGTTTMEDKVTYKLSDMFVQPATDPAIEITVTVLNVNEGHNMELMKACESLKGYSIFVSKVRKYRKEAEKEYDLTHDVPFSLLVEKDAIARDLISDAVVKSIDECIEENILKEFFLSNRKEVIEMSILEYTAEDHIKELQDESYETGYDACLEDVTSLLAWLKNNDRIDEIAGISDTSTLTRLFNEYRKNK